MKSLPQSASSSPFDSIRREDESGEYWMARELMPVLGYPRWSDFKDAIERAKQSCENVRNPVTEHFSGLSLKNPNSRQGRKYEDCKLSRYACYLIAMNGDPRKSEIASAQNYFVVKIREAEVIIPAQDAELEKLRIQLAIAQANNSTVLTQERLMLTGQSIVAMHGAPMLALIQGRPDAVVERTEVVRETVMVDANYKPVATFDGMGITEISKKLGFGVTKKGTAECRKWLQSVGIKDDDWRQEMTAHATAKLPRELMPKLKRLWAQRRGDRQMLIGE